MWRTFCKNKIVHIIYQYIGFTLPLQGVVLSLAVWHLSALAALKSVVRQWVMPITSHMAQDNKHFWMILRAWGDYQPHTDDVV